MKRSAVLFWVSLFSIAMGLFECIVVIYLRKIYYPEGFCFPLKIMEPDIITVELLREAATVIMLLAIGAISGKTSVEKFGWFIYSFAIWDNFYYIFLKLLIGWPESLMTWDILFLIPATWTGPVVAPLINSITMIILAWLIISSKLPSKQPVVKPHEWALLITGALVVIISYTLDYTRFMTEKHSFHELFDPSCSTAVIGTAVSYSPVSFPWLVFSTGVLLHLTAIALIAWRKFRKS